MSAARSNLLIISDLHLGDDLKPGVVGYLKRVVRLERELEAFLTHYTTHRLGGRPWRLVVNGDMVDFLGVCLLPTKDDLHDASTTPVELEWGLGSHPRAARAKMEKVLERHAGVFRALAGFVAAGHAVDIVVGNHDAEFHWEVVQTTFKSGVAAHAPKADAARVAEGIRFHPWFYFEEDVAWVEHGHQYDAYCSFDYVLQPAAAPDEELVMNVGAAMQRFVSNRSGYVEGQEHWGAIDYLRWGASLGWSGLSRLARGFGRGCYEVITVWRRFRLPEASAARREAHGRRLRELAEQFRLSEDTLQAIDALRQSPVFANLARVLMALMLDKLLLGATAAFLALVFFAALPWTWALGSVGIVLGGSTVIAGKLGRARDPIDVGPALRHVTRELARKVKARFFVFGHTHTAQALPMDGGAWYLNTGTWMPPEGVHAAEMRAFTHVMIRHEADGPHAALCEWRDGESREVAKAG